ncbi:hypothetical protein [Bradyrhizobium sp.]|uniref:hypothetical protein n=1 Tax=Bradyrhizobium sp. TaxID=376 RepID=UPI003C352F94
MAGSLTEVSAGNFPRNFAAIFVLLAGLGCPAAEAGFRSPESLVRNVYAYYGDGAAEFSRGLPRDEATAQQFFDPSLRAAWTAPRSLPYDFLVQSPTWKLGPLAISILRRQYDKTYVAVGFANEGRAVTLNFILVKGPEGWLITDVESPHDSLRMFLDQFRN